MPENQHEEVEKEADGGDVHAQEQHGQRRLDAARIL